ncbi:hypothetical protein HDV02_006612 [Globomyces sp. JEL0801]|nr:hypothetical protein HDV02_006612 [Globomyces sp. JEL0801]
MSIPSDDCNQMAKFIYPALSNGPGTGFKISECCTISSNVICDKDRRIIQINFDNLKLNGRIPPELNSLTKLQSISLKGNSLSGYFPDLPDLKVLQYLDLSSNDLKGVLPPSLGTLSTLQFLSVHSNSISGVIPKEISELKTLESLNLVNNSISGSIPSELFNLSKMKSLYLDLNKINGSLPEEFGKLTELMSLGLSLNDFSGSIPNSFGKLSNLEQLSLKSNHLNGQIPDELGNLSKLRSLDLSNNMLTLPIPESIKKLPKYSTDTFLFHNNDMSHSTGFNAVLFILGIFILIGLISYFVYRQWNPSLTTNLTLPNFHIPQFKSSKNTLNRTDSSLNLKDESRYLEINSTPDKLSSFLDTPKNPKYSSGILGEFDFEKSLADTTLVRPTTSHPTPILDLTLTRPSSTPPEEFAESFTPKLLDFDATLTRSNNISRKSTLKEVINTPETAYSAKSAFTPNTNATPKLEYIQPLLKKFSIKRSKGDIFFFTNWSLDETFIDLVESHYFPVDTEIKATDNFVSKNSMQVSIAKGHIVKVQRYSNDGWCFGFNQSTEMEGSFPIHCIKPTNNIKVHFIDCYKTVPYQVGSNLPEKLQLIEKVFPDCLQFHQLDLNGLQKSSLTPIMGKSKGTDKIYVHGGIEFTESISNSIKSCVKGVWKNPEIYEI